MKQTFKLLAEVIATLLVAPSVGLYLVGRLFLGEERAFPGWSQLYSLFPGTIGSYLRRAFYRLVLRRCDSGAWIGFGTILSHSTCEIGRDVYVGPYCSLGDVTLEKDVLLGSHVSIMNGGGQHGIARLDTPVREQPGAWPRVRIGEDTWIGDRAIVQTDVGAHCVIGAGSVVTRPLPDFAIAVGVPAKIIKYRTDLAKKVPELDDQSTSRETGSGDLRIQERMHQHELPEPT